jgi:hypothetical protein
MVIPVLRARLGLGYEDRLELLANLDLMVPPDPLVLLGLAISVQRDLLDLPEPPETLDPPETLVQEVRLALPATLV